MKFRSTLATTVALACLSTVALASGVQFRGTSTIGDVAQDAERISLEFAPRTETLLGGTVVSDVVRYDGPILSAFVSDGEMRICPTSACSRDGGWVASTQVRAGEFVQLRRAGPQVPSATVTTTLEVAGRRFAFAATARSQAPVFDTIPAANAEPGEARDSAISTFHGWIDTPITVSGGEYRICSMQGTCGSFTTAAGTVRDGDQVQLRVVAGAFGESRTGAAMAGGASASFRVDVRARDTTPDPIAFAALTDQAPTTQVVSTIQRLTGHDGVTVTVSGPGAQVRDCRTADCANGTTGTWATTADVARDAYVQLRTTTGGAGTTATISIAYGAAGPATWNVSTKENDDPTAVSGALYAWGAGDKGQLGNGLRTDSAVPVLVSMPSGITSFRSVSSYMDSTCAIGSDDAVYCWGSNGGGQLGTGDNTWLYAPTKIKTPAGLNGFKSLSVGDNHACAIGLDDSVYCWGSGSSGQLGNGIKSNRYTPTKVIVPPGVNKLNNVRAGYLATCATGSDGTSYCWGFNGYGGIGNGTTDDVAVPTKVSLPSGVSALTDVTPGYDGTTCGTGSDGAAYCWGNNYNGQIGDGTKTSSLRPVRVTLPAGVAGMSNVVPGIYANCALGSDSATYCWGQNNSGQIGDGTTVSRLVPTKIVLPSGIKSIKVGDSGLFRFCGSGSDGTAYCWGDNRSAALGDRTTVSRSTPVAIAIPPGVSRFVNPVSGWSTTYAIAK